MHDDERFRTLVERVGAFYVTDRTMKAAQRRVEAALAGGTLDAGEKTEYLAAVRRYFAGFEREARGHLRRVDRRLEHVNQVHFNLTAERGVAVRRIEATRTVLDDVDAMLAKDFA